MPPIAREKVHEAVREDIKNIARRQMDLQGTAAISLRAIARDMDMTAPALYRYFPRLDDLITALILDAFNSLADVMSQADSNQPADDYAARLLAVMGDYREWALAHPVDFQLIYGNPIPNYTAPAEKTVPAAKRGFAVVVNIIGQALRAGVLKMPAHFEALPPQISEHMAALIARDDYGVPPVALYLAVNGWSRIHGIIMLELFEHLQPVVGDTDVFYRFEVITQLKQMGLVFR